MMFFAETFLCSNYYFLNHIHIVFTHSQKLKLSDHLCTCVVLYTLHSDEVVSLLGLISGCEIVVCSCSPMAVTFYALLLNR